MAVKSAPATTSAGTPVIVTAGAAASQVAVALTAEGGLMLPARSVAAPCATDTVTSDPLAGVTSSV